VNLAYYGSSFTVGSDPILVTALGLFVTSTPPSGVVRIYRNGTNTNLAAATVDTNDLLSDDGRYRFEAITPITLQPGMSYTVIAHYDGGRLVRHAAGLTTQTGITFLGARAGGSGVPFTFGDGEGNGPYLGATFEFTIASPVPEPSTTGLFAIAFLAVVVRKVSSRP